MSTRSGTRIHGSFHENSDTVIVEPVVKKEKKSRSKRLKENEAIVATKSKKRDNYVRYPSEEEVDSTEQTNTELNHQNALKEQDLNVSVKNVDVVDTGKIVRQTRRTKKLSENEDAPPVIVENGKKKKTKKNKKKKEMSLTEVKENETPSATKKSKKKKGKKVNSFTEEIIVPETKNLDRSAESVDSFHSAAGSPVNRKGVAVAQPDTSVVKSPRRATKRLKPECSEGIKNACAEDETVNQSSKKRKLSLYEKSEEVNNRSLRSKDVNDAANINFNKSQDVPEILNGTLEKSSQKNRRSSIKNSTFDKTDTPTKSIGAKKLNSTMEKTYTPSPRKSIKFLEVESKSKRVSLRSSLVPDSPIDKISLNSTYEKSETNSAVKRTVEKTKKSLQSALNSTFEKSTDSKQSILNSTFDKNKVTGQSFLNTTFDKSKDSTPSKLNSTFDKNKKSRQSMNTTFDNVKDSNSTFEKPNESKGPSLNSTYEKSECPKEPIHNTTFDKESKLNSTYDKDETKSDSSKSSLVSSDGASNVTLDKSDDNSRISITSDDSRTENIVNTTPVLIESSMDESQVQDPTPKKPEEEAKIQPSTTPLKREGTFTKDGPDIVMSPNHKRATPVKCMSLSSPGSTPFLFTKSGQKEKCMLNVTRSIEKANRRSSLAEPTQRMTKVMFCSPVNNPAVVMQQKKKVIKSSMKGSNKSFVFDERVSAAVTAQPRKRSYTHNDADEARAKRSRLADPQQRSVDRLARPRTCSATVKPSEPSTPSKKPATPLKATPGARPVRTRLPNFAALHEREFAKMESLDQHQRRRARRARTLLTPTGARALIEKSSPKHQIKATSEPPKPLPVKETAKEAVKKTEARTDTPTKTPKPPSLMSLRPGYTRFGFKMHVDDNPFSAAPKTDIKPRASKPAVLKRQPTQPALIGTASNRREVAKQTVMREKSFTSLSQRRDVTRKEIRSVIKGVRTNRRFELQMKMRDINP